MKKERKGKDNRRGRGGREKSMTGRKEENNDD